MGSFGHPALEARVLPAPKTKTIEYRRLFVVLRCGKKMMKSDKIDSNRILQTWSLSPQYASQSE